MHQFPVNVVTTYPEKLTEVLPEGDSPAVTVVDAWLGSVCYVRLQDWRLCLSDLPVAPLDAWILSAHVRHPFSRMSLLPWRAELLRALL